MHLFPMLAAIVCFAPQSTPQPAAEPVRLAAALSEGQVLRYDISTDLKLESSHAELSEHLKQEIRLRFTIAQTSPDGAIVRAAPERLRIHHASGDGPELAFEWNEGDPAPDGEADAPLDRLYRQLSTTVFELVLDTRGNIVEASGLERLPAAGRGLPDAVRAMGILGPDAVRVTLQPLFNLDDQARPRSVSESWATTRSMKTTVWQSTARTESTLTSIRDNTATILSTTTITPDARKPDTDAPNPVADIPEQSVKARATWDCARSRLLTREVDAKVTWRAVLPVKQPIEARNTTASRITFKLVEP